jgi:xylulokinase
MGFLLGIDIGTSATKVLLCDERGEVIRTASSAHTVMQPRAGWSEQDPAEWWGAVVRAIREVLEEGSVRGEEIAGVGLSGQMHGSVFLSRETITGGGANAVAIRPALLWNDQRTAAQCVQIEAAVGGRAALVREVGNAALTGSTAPKILWLKENEPENYAKVAAICLPKDFMGFCLTGTLATDAGDASGTLLFDVARI